MGRRKRDNSFDIAKGIAALALVGGVLLVGGDIRKLSDVLPLLVMGTFGVCGLFLLGLLAFYLLKGRQAPTTLSAVIRPRVSERVSIDEDFSRSPIEAPKLFTEDLIKKLEWRRFEQLVQGLFRAEGFSANRIRAGADGGIDLVLRENEDGPVKAIVQCKAWSTYTVGVKPVRELFGVMAAEGAPLGYFVCSGRYTAEAREWAKYKSMTLIDGSDLVERLNRLEPEVRGKLLEEITEGDYTTPTCPSCDIKLVRRSGKYGEFWGCRSYPRCKAIIRS